MCAIHLQFCRKRMRNYIMFLVYTYTNEIPVQLLICYNN